MFSLISSFFNEVFYRPLFNALVYLVNVLPFHDVGLAIIILTLIARFILLPLTHKSTKTQHKMKELEPDLKKIKDEVKNKEEQARKIMELYKQHGVNPFSGIILLFIQLPILFALFFVFKEDIQTGLDALYAFVPHPEFMQTTFLGFINLRETSVVLAFLTGFSQFLQMKLAQKPGANKKPINKTKPAKGDFSRLITLQMTYVMPFVIFLMALRIFPGAISLYWTTNNIFAIVHEGFVRRKAKKINEGGNRENSSNDTGAH